MKNLLLLAGAVLIARLLFIAAMIWPAVEFILFLAKDDPFNWLSIVAVVGSGALFFALLVWFLGKRSEINYEEYKNSRYRSPKFAERLEAMQRQKAENK